MAVNDKKVRQIFEKALHKHISKKSGYPQVCAAFNELYIWRNDPQKPNASIDEDLAAAEHYLLSRCWVSNGKYSVLQMKTWVLLYANVKIYVPEKLVRHNPNRPPAPWSYQQTIWGLKGAEDGEHDRKRYHPSVEPSFGSWYKPPTYKK